ncbi:MAG: xanthine dehydrogenase family protein molybdopterin-binding subunit [Acetobacteraceae bacterium]
MAGAATPRPLPSSSPRRPELRPLLLGRGRFLDDLALPGMLHAAFVRSPHAAAGIEAIETARARAMPGVAAVLTGADLRGQVRPIVTRLEPERGAIYRASEWPALALGEVHYVGEAVAVVAAESRYVAEDAAAEIAVAYAPRPAVAEVSSALAPSAPAVHEGLPDNRLFTTTLGQTSAPDDNAISVGARFRHPRVTGAAIENRGALAEFRRAEGELVLWSATQIPHLLRTLLRECLRLDGISVRVIAPDVGGGFGIKMQAFPEELVVAHLALRLGRPVKWTEDRMENLLASVHARDVIVEAELSARSDGAFVSLAARASVNVGAYSSYPLSAALEPLTIASALPGPYRFPAYRYQGSAVATHCCPVGAFRGVGFTIGPLVTEGLIDRLARKLGVDPLELRTRNLISRAEMPAKSAAGVLYDSGDYPALLAAAAERAGYRQWREEQARGRAEGRALGIGIACFVEATGMNRAVYRRRGMVHVPGYDAARLTLEPDGTLEAAVSTPSQGQWQRHAFSRLLAERLGIAEGGIRIVLGDTARTPYGSGTFASRGMVGGGGALLAAAGQLEERLLVLASSFWNLPIDAFQYCNGGVEQTGHPCERLSLAQLASYGYGPDAPLAAESEPGIVVHCTYDPPISPHSAAVHLAFVEVDRPTGRVRIIRYVVAEDCGRMVDRAGVDGQICGGIAQGIGSALLEEIVYDDAGQLLTASLADYLLPTAADIPPIEILHRETAAAGIEGGMKGVGESGAIGAPAAIAGAVLDALDAAPEEVRLPLTPARVRALA